MGINLTKGEKISLAKVQEGLSKVRVGLGWDVIEKTVEKKGFFSKILGTTTSAQDADLDASVLLLNGNGKLVAHDNMIYFGNLRSKCGGVVHSGDNRTGSGSGDDEVIRVDLQSIDGKVEKILFIVNIYKAIERNQDFGMIKNAYIKVYDDKTNTELIRYSLSDEYAGKTNVLVGSLEKINGEWEFTANGEGLSLNSLQAVRDFYA